MAIWSLTEERVQKLLQQIGEKEHEIDVLIKLSVKDLWNRDLDEFIAEWRFQLEDDAKRQRKVAHLGRRASNKLKIGAKGPAARKRKAQGDDPDDSDFAASKPKKAGGVTRVQPKPASAFFSALKGGSPGGKPATKATKATKTDSKPVKAENKPAPVVKAGFNMDGSSDGSVDIKPMPIDTKQAKDTGDEKALNDTSNHGASDIATADSGNTRGRKARLVASSPVKYLESNGSESDDGNDMLGDVSKMVKGIGSGSIGSSNGAAKPFLSTFASRTASAATTSIAESAKEKPKRNLKQTIELSDDETDFSRLAPRPMTQKAQQSSSTLDGQRRSLDEEDVDSSDFLVERAVSTKTKAATSKAAVPKRKVSTMTSTTTKAKKAKTPAVEAPPEQLPLSPAAKAYAAKRAVKRQVVESDEEEDVDDLISPEKGPKKGKAAPLLAAAITTTAARPARRAAAAAPKRSLYIDSDSEEQMEEPEEEEASEDDLSESE